MRIRYNILLATLGGLLYGCSGGGDSDTRSAVAPKEEMVAIAKEQADQFVDEKKEELKEKIVGLQEDMQEKLSL